MAHTLLHDSGGGNNRSSNLRIFALGRGYDLEICLVDSQRVCMNGRLVQLLALAVTIYKQRE